MDKDTIALIISGLSFIVAWIALGWNIYKEFIKPRLKVGFGLYDLVGPGFKDPRPRLSITATNFGPGAIQLNGVFLKNAPLWRKLLKKVKHAFVIHDYPDLLGAKLPCRLEIGEHKDIFLKLDKDCFLKEGFTHIGVRDTFGRIHWASRKDYKRTKKSFEDMLEKDQVVSNDTNIKNIEMEEEK